MSVAGHYWTVSPRLRHVVAPEPGPPSWGWRGSVADPQLGPVRLSGLLHAVPGARALVVIVHGLGGRHHSPYCARAAMAAARLGASSLRLSLRGADRSGEDFGHAGLTADVHAALGSPEAAGHDAIYLVGYSVGGHVVLRAALEGLEPRLRAVAAICPVLDLAASADAFDSEVAWPYRTFVLAGLKNIYAEVARRRPVPAPLRAVVAARSVREWDRLAVVPRHGFAGVDEYYERESVDRRLGGLRVPALVVASEQDPMVPARVVRRALAHAPRGMEVRFTREGGHVGFPERVDLGLGAPGRVEDQVLRWLLAR